MKKKLASSVLQSPMKKKASSVKKSPLKKKPSSVKSPMKKKTKSEEKQGLSPGQKVTPTSSSTQKKKACTLQKKWLNAFISWLTSAMIPNSSCSFPPYEKKGMHPSKKMVECLYFLAHICNDSKFLLQFPSLRKTCHDCSALCTQLSRPSNPTNPTKIWC